MLYHIPFGSFVSSDRQVNTPFRVPTGSGALGIEITDDSYSIIESSLGWTCAEAQAVNHEFSICHFDKSLGVRFPNLFRLSEAGSYTLDSESDIRLVFKKIESEVKKRNIRSAVDSNEKPPSLIFLIDSDSYDLEALDHKYLESLFEKNIVNYSAQANAVIVIYGKNEDDSLFTLIRQAASPIISFSFSNKKSCKISHEGICSKVLFLTENLGYKWENNAFSEWEKLQASLLIRINKDNRDFLSLPVGVSETGGDLMFSLGESSGVYHAFVVGTNGTGKTTFLNNIILGVAENYSAKQVELYLADLKQGVEFQYFAEHPNCRAIILGDERKDDMLSLFKDFSAKIKERGRLFTEEKVRDLAEYNAAHPEKSLPRLLLIVDEAQQLFVGSWRQANEFSTVFEKVVRQGRGFGIHVILSTQTLTNANISGAIMSQIPLRIAFKLIASEVYRIFPTNNDAPSKLDKYQFIYNAEAGIPEANRFATALPPQDLTQVINVARAGRNESDCISPAVISGEPVPNLDENADQGSLKTLLTWDVQGLKKL